MGREDNKDGSETYWAIGIGSRVRAIRQRIVELCIHLSACDYQKPHRPLLTGFNESCCPAIIMVEAAENREGNHLASALSFSLSPSYSRNSLFDPLMWTRLVQELHVLLDHAI